MQYTLPPRSSSPRATLTVQDARGITESVVGSVEWFDEFQGWCRCPGEGSHTTPTGHDACKVVCGRVALSAGELKPGVYCFHESCGDATEAASRSVRSLLGKAEPSKGGPIRHEPRASKPLKPVYDPAKLERVASRVPSISEEWIIERSPKRIDTRTPASFLTELYLPGENVVVFNDYESQGQAVWTCKAPPYNARELDRFTSGCKNGVWFLSNPVTGEYAESDRRKNGKPVLSRRCWQTVTAWRYLVLESDKAPADQWLAALVQMPLPIAAVYTSGGKSIHALVRLDAASKDEWNRIANSLKPWLTVLGADPRAISAVRLTRLPLCERLGARDKKGVYHAYPAPRTQRLLYLNGCPSSTPLFPS